ncbi:MAG: S26 family signal peptidase [Candidatus Diapherotrites archaeon]
MKEKYFSGKNSFVVTGNSMAPTAKTFTATKIYFNSSKPEFGDIIVFRQRGKLIAHRFLGRRNNGINFYLITKGDNHLFFDGPVEAKKVVGKIVELNGRKMKEFPLKQLNKLIALFSLIQGTLFTFFYKRLSTKKIFCDKKGLWQRLFRPALIRITNPALLVPLH